MPFINEFPPREAIIKYQMAGFEKDHEKPEKWRRIWTTDRERGFHLYGATIGRYAFGEEVVGKFYFHLNGPKFTVYLEPGCSTSVYKDDPYIVQWGPILRIHASFPDQSGGGGYLRQPGRSPTARSHCWMGAACMRLSPCSRKR